MKKMKKMKKYLLLILALNMLFMSYESEKRKAEAFAIETAALILGGMAIVGAGGVILSRTGAGTLGEKISSGFEATGAKIADIFSYNSVTDKGNLIMSPVLKMAMNNAIGQLKSESSSYVGDGLNSNTVSKTGVGTVSMNAGVLVSTGDMVRISFDYTSTNAGSYGNINAEVGGAAAAGATKLVYFNTKPNGSYSGTIQITKSTTKSMLSIVGTASSDAGTVTMSNLKVENLTIMSTAGYQQYKQYESYPADANARLTQIDNTLTQSSYDVSANNVQENVSDISQLQSSMTAIEDNTAGTNTLIDRMITALGNIPAAIKAETSDLWADAGAIWSGMGDTLVSTQADVNAKLANLADTTAMGLDNVKIGLTDAMESIRGGIDSFAATAAANWASWGQLTLDGIDAGIGAITSGLTNAWTNTTTAIDTASTAAKDGIGAINTEIGKIATFITDLPNTLLRLIVPAEGEFSMKEKIAELARLLEQKFGSLNDLYGYLEGATTTGSGSIYNIEVSLLGKQYKIVPIFLKPTIDAARPFLTAAVNLTSITFLVHRNKKELFK